MADLARDLANAPLSKKIQDLKYLKAMYDTRIHKTQSLMNDVVVGKLKKSGVSDTVLYALMKNDIKLLEGGRCQVLSQIDDLQKKLDDEMAQLDETAAICRNISLTTTEMALDNTHFPEQTAE